VEEVPGQLRLLLSVAVRPPIDPNTIRVRSEVATFLQVDVNGALQNLESSKIHGAGVLVIQGTGGGAFRRPKAVPPNPSATPWHKP
jgi:hypothetical protein